MASKGALGSKGSAKNRAEVARERLIAIGPVFLRVIGWLSATSWLGNGWLHLSAADCLSYASLWIFATYQPISELETLCLAQSPFRN
jgi:hypothetical protein